MADLKDLAVSPVFLAEITCFLTFRHAMNTGQKRGIAQKNFATL